LFATITHHPQNTSKVSEAENAIYVAKQMTYLRRFLENKSVFVEIGPGDCALSFDVANEVNQVYAIDVSDEITKASKSPVNFKLILSDGVSIPIKEKADIVYSNQLIEHLHEDDVEQQLQNIVTILNKGGKYVCISPSRLTGPHDVSKHFDKVAKGFHLKEYTFKELRNIFLETGFTSVYGYWGAKGKFIKIPGKVIVFTESLFNLLPRKLLKNKIASFFLNIRIVGVK